MRNTMNRKMMNICRHTMSTMPGVDRGTLQDVFEMRFRSEGAGGNTHIAETLLGEKAAVNANYRSWFFALI